MIFKNLDQVDTTNIPVVIVGSGPAGITLALELEKNNIESLIIEAGDEKYSYDSQQSYNGEIVGDSISGLTHNRLRQFGGTSGHWGGWSRPLEEYNFEKWNITS
jgi:2-polyprenyl-6-methoxyphenol hydroxylase-like FAD-dependent oxidoreductase